MTARIEKMLRKRGLDVDNQDEAGPSTKRRRTSPNQSILDNLVTATAIWAEEDGNRTYKAKGKGSNAMAMAKRWRGAMTAEGVEDWADEQLLYNFVTVSKEVARQEQIAENNVESVVNHEDDD